ncbi:MAG: T9SS type A sorting domain-containing protein [Fidelibacterota bacterium]
MYRIHTGLSILLFLTLTGHSLVSGGKGVGVSGRFDPGRFVGAQGEVPDQTTVNVANITVWVRQDGFHDWTVDGSWNGTFPRGEMAGVVFSEGMVWGGLVNDGSTPALRVGGSTYKSGNLAGPVMTDASGNVTGPGEEVRPYRVRPDWVTADLTRDAANFFLKPEEELTDEDVATLRAWYETDWNDWPAHLGAPYEEINGQDGYQPATWDSENDQWNTDGDIPGIPGADQTVWIIYNDLDPELTAALYGSPPVGLEVQETYWAYHRFYELWNAVFKRVRLIYKGTTATPEDATIEGMYISQWSDPDLGDYRDDVAGSDSLLDLGYVYNGDPSDWAWDMLGLTPPAAGYDILQGPIVYTGDPSDSALYNFGFRKGYVNLPMTAFVPFAAGSPRSDPTLNDYSGTLQWYNLMRCCEPRPEYPSCDPILDHLGNPTCIELAGDPVLGEGDLDGTPSPYDGHGWFPGDRRLTITSGPFSMARGDTQEVVISLSGAFGADRILSVTALKDNVRGLRRAFLSGFTDMGPGARLSELSAPHNTEETGPFEIILAIENDPTWEPEIESAWLHYGVAETGDSVAMTETVYNGTKAYLATVPSFPEVTGTTVLRYHLSVRYTDGTPVLLPYGAPANHLSLVFGPDTTAPGITDLSQLPDVLYLQDSRAEITGFAEDDRFPIAEVTARWKVNHDGEVRDSTMVRGDGFWVGVISWRDLSLGDTVYYWAEATDSSRNGNVGSSDVKWFVAGEHEKLGNWDMEWVAPWDWGNSWSLRTETGYGKVAELYTALSAGEGDALTRVQSFRLSDELPRAFLSFDQSYVFIEPNVGYLELKREGGDWEPLVMWSGLQTSFEPLVLPLGSYIPSDSVFIRFRAEGHGDEKGVIWKIDDIFLTLDSALAVSGNGPAAIPARYELNRIFPNPFNPSSTIEFSTPRAGPVVLTVYDLLGREVATLLNRELTAGYHKVHWNAGTVPSGIYLVRMQSGDLIQTRKVTVLK